RSPLPCSLVDGRSGTVSTPSERLEAVVWLESTLPDAPPDLAPKFLASVDAYYTEHPTAERGTDILAILEDDHRAFALILRAVLSGADPRAAVDSAVELPTH